VVVHNYFNGETYVFALALKKAIEAEMPAKKIPIG
jgi:hypothetical protein